MINKNRYTIVEPYARLKSDGNGGIFLRVNADADPEKRDFYEVVFDFTGDDRSSASSYRVTTAVMYPSGKMRHHRFKHITVAAVAAALRARETSIQEILQKYLNKP